MQSLLRWSIENAGDQSTSNEGASQQPTGPKELDTGVLDVIMGRPESELMKEALAVAVDSEKSEDDLLAGRASVWAVKDVSWDVFSAGVGLLESCVMPSQFVSNSTGNDS